MAQVISFEQALYARAQVVPHGLIARDAMPDPSGSLPGNQQLQRRESIYRMVLLLETAAQHARRIVKQVSDPARRAHFEAQIATIEHQIQQARSMAINL